jgi:DNA-binding CsgD family transcriptional regulator
MAKTSQNEPLGAAIAAIGTAACPARLAEWLRATIPYSYTVIFGYRGAARPTDLYDDFPADRRKTFVTDYQDGPYLLDPLYLAASRPVPAGLYRLRDLAPDRFYQGEYFRNYYIQTGLAEEIAFFLHTGGDSVVVLSLMRADRPFSPKEFRDVQALWPLVDAIARQHWARLDHILIPNPLQAQDIALSFSSFGEGTLTRRERQIVEFTLKGHSAEAMGAMLGISPGTVRIHRRNIYAKLRIRSQGELFSQFIDAMSGRQGADRHPREATLD